jgi:hypothetical protein
MTQLFTKHAVFTPRLMAWSTSFNLRISPILISLSILILPTILPTHFVCFFFTYYLTLYRLNTHLLYTVRTKSRLWYICFSFFPTGFFPVAWLWPFRRPKHVVTLFISDKRIRVHWQKILYVLFIVIPVYIVSLQPFLKVLKIGIWLGVVCGT